MKNLRTLAYLYLLLCSILIATLFGLILVADKAALPQHWTDSSVATILDMIKVVIGAAVGSLSSAIAILLESKKEKN